jgi:hypothetical protein
MPTKKSSTLVKKPKSNLSKSAKKSSFKFRWWYAVIAVLVVAVVGIAVIRLSRAGTAANTYYAANGGIKPIANTPSTITYDTAVASNVILSNISGNSTAFYQFSSPIAYQPGVGNKIQSCVYYSVTYVPEKDTVGTTISLGPNSVMVHDSGGKATYSNGPGGYRISCSNFAINDMKSSGAFPANAIKGNNYNITFNIYAGFNSSAANVPLKIWKVEIVDFFGAK